MVCRTFQQLADQIRKKVDVSLEKEVAPVVKAVIKQHIRDDVLSVYKPELYMRRVSGGINDPAVLISEHPSSGTLFVKNVAVPSPSLFETQIQSDDPTLLSKWIEYGDVPNYWTERIEPWEQPRPFMSNAINELTQSKKHMAALKKGLKKQGVKTE